VTQEIRNLINILGGSYIHKLWVSRIINVCEFE